MRDIRTNRVYSTLDAYTLHKPTRIRFPRRWTVSRGIADLFQIDLVDLLHRRIYETSLVVATENEDRSRCGVGDTFFPKLQFLTNISN